MFFGFGVGFDFFSVYSVVFILASIVVLVTFVFGVYFFVFSIVRFGFRVFMGRDFFGVCRKRLREDFRRV